MKPESATTCYADLIRQAETPQRTPRSVEEEVNRLIDCLHRDPDDNPADEEFPPDPIRVFRRHMRDELIPAFRELSTRYATSGITMELDADRFLDGGRTIHFTFRHGDYKSTLEGTVTSDSIAFLEVRHSPICDGHLGDGPLLRIRGLTEEKFSEFVCQRLTLLLRWALRDRA